MARQRRSVLAIDADMPTAWGIKGAWNRREVDGLAFAAKRAAITMAPVVEPVFASVFTARLRRRLVHVGERGRVNGLAILRIRDGGGQRVVGRRGHGDGRRVLGAVIRDAIGVAGDLHERVLVRAGSVERQLVESDSAIGCVRGSARHPPRTQPQGERLRFARHRRRDRIRPRRRQQRCRYARPPVHEQVQEPGRAVHVGRRRHRPRPDHQGCG